MKMYKYPKIFQFKNVVKKISMDYDLPLPKVTMKGCVKLHGTNAGVTFSENDGLYCQSRNNVITVENDNAGFCKFVSENRHSFDELFKQVKDRVCTYDDITIFGEWCGGSIQKGVAINGLDKMFVIFNVQISPEEGEPYFVDESFLESSNERIFNINSFPCFELEIDFNNPEISTNTLREMTEEVEKCCPVGKFFGVEGVGEGVVWSTILNGELLNFKVKGEKHSTTKVKKLAAVDEELLRNKTEFVEYALTENRLNQGIEQVFTSKSIDPDMSNTGDLIKWICNDIIDEESDALEANGLDFKQVNTLIAKKTASWFKEYLWS